MSLVIAALESDQVGSPAVHCHDGSFWTYSDGQVVLEIEVTIESYSYFLGTYEPLSSPFAAISLTSKIQAPFFNTCLLREEQGSVSTPKPHLEADVASVCRTASFLLM